jgi:uncharacterized protein (DUF305 family)
MTAATDHSQDVSDMAPEPRYPRWMLVVMGVVCAAALFVAGFAVAIPTGIGRPAAPPGDTSVDAGFTRDMLVHHQQAIQMAGFVRDHTGDAGIRLLAYVFKGWLDVWGLLAESDHTPMAWMAGAHMHMGTDGLMPGMATQAELAKLKTLTGRELDVMFLQLMIRHHQGGIPMAQYAATHAQTSYVQLAARKMADAQSLEVINMEKTLRDLGGSPLPPPA